MRGLLIAALVVATGCSKADPPASGTEQKAKPPSTLVNLGKAEDGRLTDGWRFLGRVEPALASKIAAAVESHVTKVHVREGDTVTKGQTLLTLDAAKVRANVDAARAREKSLAAQYELAERQFKRIEKLGYPTVSAPERERVELEVSNLAAQRETQQAEIRAAEIELGRHALKAPFAGVISQRFVDPGAWVGFGDPVLALVSLTDLEIHVDVSVELGGRLTKGGKVKLIARDQTGAATITGIVPALDSDTRTMRVLTKSDTAYPWLIPGLAVDVEFPLTYEDGGVLVSRDALIRGPVSTRIMKVVDGKAVPIKVEVVATADDKALVRGPGLSAGDDIVVRGNERLRPGQDVRLAQ